MPRLRVVIPHYGPQELLDRAMAAAKVATSKERLPEWETDLVAVDNNKENRFFTAAVNCGILSKNAPPAHCYWVLNNDAIADPDCARSAISRLAAWPHVAAVGSRNVSIKNPDIITWGGSAQCWPAGRHIVGSVATGHCAELSKQEWLPFASVFIRGAALEEVGVLDRNMAHIFSDADWCFRARWNGGICLYDPGSQIRHDFGSSAKPSEHVAKIMAADAARFHAKWRGSWMSHLSVWPAE
jgi:GT2 family glycosyltransferase